MLILKLLHKTKSAPTKAAQLKRRPELSPNTKEHLYAEREKSIIKQRYAHIANVRFIGQVYYNTHI